MAKRKDVPIHSKKSDVKGRTKDKRHGTRGFTSWVTEPRVDPAASFRHAGKRKP